MAERAKVYIGEDDTPIIVCGRDLWALRQLIHVRCFHIRMPTEETRPVVQVIDANHQDVRAILCTSYAHTEQEQQCEEFLHD